MVLELILGLALMSEFKSTSIFVFIFIRNMIIVEHALHILSQAHKSRTTDSETETTNYQNLTITEV